MRPEYLQYAELLASDLDKAGQPVSAKVVRSLLDERGDSLAACRAMIAVTGGSENWNGETHDALLLMEATIAKSEAH